MEVIRETIDVNADVMSIINMENTILLRLNRIYKFISHSKYKENVYEIKVRLNILVNKKTESVENTVIIESKKDLLYIKNDLHKIFNSLKKALVYTIVNSPSEEFRSLVSLFACIINKELTDFFYDTKKKEYITFCKCIDPKIKIELILGKENLRYNLHRENAETDSFNDLGYNKEGLEILFGLLKK